MPASSEMTQSTRADAHVPGQEGEPQSPSTTPERKDELMEADLENTFPASDPVTPKHIT